MDVDNRRSATSPIRSVFCCGSCTQSASQSSNFELGQIYLGDHLTRTWNRPVKAAPIPPKSPTSPFSDNVPAAFKESEQGILAKGASIRRSSRRRKIKNIKEILSTYNITSEDLNLWSNSFDALLKNEAGLHIFRNFLESEFAEENLKFWLACEDLKNNRHNKKLERKIQDIYDTYIDTHSSSEVNIDYKMRENIVHQLQTNDVTIFTEAQHQIYSLMYRDSYPRFLNSNFVIDLVKEVNGRESKKSSLSLEQGRSASSAIIAATATNHVASSNRNPHYFTCCVRKKSSSDEITTNTSYQVVERTKNSDSEGSKVGEYSKYCDLKSSSRQQSHANGITLPQSVDFNFSG